MIRVETLLASRVTYPPKLSGEDRSLQLYFPPVHERTGAVWEVDVRLPRGLSDNWGQTRKDSLPKDHPSSECRRVSRTFRRYSGVLGRTVGRPEGPSL